jgi:hypothetical protein
MTRPALFPVPSTRTSDSCARLPLQHPRPHPPPVVLQPTPRQCDPAREQPNLQQLRSLQPIHPHPPRLGRRRTAPHLLLPTLSCSCAKPGIPPTARRSPVAVSTKRSSRACDWHCCAATACPPGSQGRADCAHPAALCLTSPGGSLRTPTGGWLGGKPGARRSAPSTAGCPPATTSRKWVTSFKTALGSGRPNCSFQALALSLLGIGHGARTAHLAICEVDDEVRFGLDSRVVVERPELGMLERSRSRR